MTAGRTNSSAAIRRCVATVLVTMHAAPDGGQMHTSSHERPHDCLRFPSVRDPEWVEARFGHI